MEKTVLADRASSVLSAEVSDRAGVSESHSENVPGIIPGRVAPPFGDQRFDNFDQWVSRASSWLTCHMSYNNTEHGDKAGWRGNHFTALCFDSLGRRCRIGSDMHRARDEGAFPVWWIWPDQIVEIVSRAATLVTALREASETTRELVSARWSEAEGSPEDWTRDIDAAIAKAEGLPNLADAHTNNTPSPILEG